MNWTGGRLQQSRRSRSATNTKQRAHFAKARARLQNGSIAPPPPRFAILQEYQPGGRAAGSEPSYNVASTLAPSSQRKLDEYPSIAPTVKKLASMGSRQNSIERSRTSGRQSHSPVPNKLEGKRAVEHAGDFPTTTLNDEGENTITALYLTSGVSI